MATRDIRPTVEALSKAIKWMVRILAPIVAAVVLIGAIGGTTALITGLVMNHGLRWVCIALAVFSYFAATILSVRYTATVRATNEPETLTNEFYELTQIGDIADHMIINAHTAVTTQGGLRPWQRARALWRILQTMNVVETHVNSRRHVRYVLPPKLPQSWFYILMSFWAGATAFIGTILIIIIVAITS